MGGDSDGNNIPTNITDKFNDKRTILTERGYPVLSFLVCFAVLCFALLCKRAVESALLCFALRTDSGTCMYKWSAILFDFVFVCVVVVVLFLFLFTIRSHYAIKVRTPLKKTWVSHMSDANKPTPNK